MSASTKIIELRQLLAAKYPAVPVGTGTFVSTGLPLLDGLLGGGLPGGGMTEIVCGDGSGGLMLTTLVGETLRRRGLLALVDAADAFDPAGLPKAALARMLWVRSRTVAQAVQATDLLLRDGNLHLVVLDLRSSRPEETRKIPMSSWYRRLQRVVEPTATAFVVLTRQPSVSGARPRLTLEARFTLDALRLQQRDLLARLQVALARGSEERWQRSA